MKTPEQMAEEYIESFKGDKSILGGKIGLSACRLSFLAGYKAAQEHNADASKMVWISVKDRLPENKYITVLVHFRVPESKAKLYGFGYCESDGPVTWYVDHNRYKSPVDVTHWMPLPEPPKAEK